MIEGEEMIMKKFWDFSVTQGSLWMNIDDIPEIVDSRVALESWLHTDVRGFAKTLDYIDDVLAGNVEEDRLGGDGFKAYVKRDFTEIHFNYEEEDPSVKPCTLPTKLLREIVKAWLEEYEKFRASKKK